MPTVSLDRDELFRRLGRTFSDHEFDELCFEFGVELDEITSEREEALKSDTGRLSKGQLDALSDTVIYKIDVPANRYDLLCMEGITRALKIFLRDMDPPVYSVLSGAQTHVITVHPATARVRPYIVCAVLRDVTFTQERYESFIDLQDQLHRNLCRQRTLVAIGTHDLDTLQGPFSYDALPGDQIHFVPLTHTASSQSFSAKELLEHYETDPACKHLKPYVPIIKHSPVYPVVLDAHGTVLSLPPIINGSHSRIQLSTTNIFIECTATDLTKANIVLDTVVAMFSEYAALPFTVEPVQVQYVDESGSNMVRSYVTPIMYTRQERTSIDFVNSMIGIQLTPEQMVQLCNKVQLGPASLSGTDNQWLQVTVPPTRSDILHPVDIAEDIGIAYGYNNIVRRMPTTSTVGSETPLNKLSDLLREEISRAGYIEVLTHGLCSIQDNFTALQRPLRLHSAVSLSNPANVEYQVVRTSLLPGLLKTLEHNKAMSFAHGFKVFEISDVVLVDTSHVITQTIIGAKNSRRICAVYASTTSGFEIIHGLVDRIMTLTEVAPEKAYVENSLKKGAAGGADSEERCRISREGWYYTIRELQVNFSTTASASTPQSIDERLVSAATDAGYSYFPGRAAEILLSRPHVSEGSWVPIGTFGILHPIVLNNFNIQYPSSCLEMDLEPLL